jgi:hypothetical protein
MSNASTPPNRPAPSGRNRSLAEIMTPRRPNIFNNDDTGPGLPWDQRNKWLRQVRKLAADCRRRHESFPHKVEAVARAIAELGDIAKAGLDYIADKAGCVVNTVEAAITWLESKGALTWKNTSGKDRSGHIVRKTNLYTLIMDFAGSFAAVVRVMRSLWRERSKVVTVSKRNECHGLPHTYTSEERSDAQAHLTKVRKDRTATLNAQWALRHST